MRQCGALGTGHVDTGDDVWVGHTADDDVYPEDLQRRRPDNGPRWGPPESTRWPVFSFHGLHSRERYRELVRDAKGGGEPDAGTDGTMGWRGLSLCETSWPVVQQPWPLRPLDSPILTEAPPPSLHWLMESSCAPLPADTARLATPDGLAGLESRSDRWDVFRAVDLGGARGAQHRSFEVRNSVQERMAASVPVAPRGGPSSEHRIDEDEDARVLDVLWDDHDTNLCNRMALRTLCDSLLGSQVLRPTEPRRTGLGRDPVSQGRRDHRSLQ